VTANLKEKGRHGISRLIRYVQQEKEGCFIDEKIVREEFSDWIYCNSERLDPTKGSIARQILCVMSTKGREKGRETRATAGWTGLVKGNEIKSKEYEKIANAKWEAIKNGPLKDWEKSTHRWDKQRAKKFRELDSMPWQERSKWMKKAANNKTITWYSAEKPNGLRFDGDGDKKVISLEILDSDRDDEISLEIPASDK
jgi:hypothetical protein